MIAKAPATIANEIQARLVRLMEQSSTYLSPNNIALCRISDDLDKLGKVDAALRSVLLAWLNVVTGNREQVEYNLNNAQKLHATEVQIGLAKLTMLINFGYLSEALPLFEYFAKPDFAVVGLFLDKPPTNGACHAIAAVFERAKTMNLENRALHRPEFSAAAEIMDQWGDSDEDYSKALDIAGDIMRERNMFFKGEMVTVPVQAPRDGSLPYVKLVFNIHTDFDTAIDMTSEYSERLARSDRKIPPSMVFEFDSLDG